MPAPNYVEYHKSLSAELRATKDRLKQLIDHRLKLGWSKPEELGEKILLDFMESATGKTYRTPEHQDRWGLEEADDEE